MTTNTVRWNIAVSQDTDHALRVFLADHGGRKGDLSRFVEEAVKAHILEITAGKAKASNKSISEKKLSEIVDEAILWARKNK